MDHFSYRDGVLYASDVSIADIADAVGTPFYCYDADTIRRHYSVLDNALSDVAHVICFAVKANSNHAVLKLLANLGAGADVVSQGEIRRALAVGIPAERIVFSGIGKTAEELAFALDHRVGQFNVESEAELRLLNRIACDKGVKAAIALRVNPDVDAGTHDHITTGRKEDKFGVAWDSAAALYDLAGSLEGIDVRAVSVHIGSQLTDLSPFEQAFTKVAGLVRSLRASGHTISRVDLGGGIGIPYHTETPPTPQAYADLVKRIFADLDVELLFEPGRMIVGNAGIFVTRVIYEKITEHKRFLIVDAGMNDLIRPAMYQAYHHAIPVYEPSPSDIAYPYDVAGPVCETTDVFCKDRMLPALQANDLLALRSAGAYGSVMSSQYNTRPLPAEVIVDGDRYGLTRAREDYDAILARDIIPEWLK